MKLLIEWSIGYRTLACLLFKGFAQTCKLAISLHWASGWGIRLPSFTLGITLRIKLVLYRGEAKIFLELEKSHLAFKESWFYGCKDSRKYTYYWYREPLYLIKLLKLWGSLLFNYPKTFAPLSVSFKLFPNTFVHMTPICFDSRSPCGQPPSTSVRRVVLWLRPILLPCVLNLHKPTCKHIVNKQ